MKIIISPAKKMNINTDMLPVRKPPRFQKEVQEMCRTIQKQAVDL